MAAGLRHLPPDQHSGHTPGQAFRDVNRIPKTKDSNCFAARYNVDAKPNVWVGKIAHGSYDNWCDGHGLVRNI